MPQAQWIWLSHVSDYESFEGGEKDADSMAEMIPTTNEIRWVEALESLMAGTGEAEYQIASNKLDTPISPTNVSVRRQCSYGSNTVQPVRVNDVLLFVDFVGRKVRELVYQAYPVDKYVAPDLTSLSEHITLSGITTIAHQKNPDSILWATLADGSLLTMTYERDQKVVAWSRQPIDGFVTSVCVCPHEDEDRIYISVVRVIGGELVYYIERFMPRVWTALADAFYVDCGKTCEFDTPTSVITGLDHLEGKTVLILGDGVIQTPKIVTGGAITLDTAVLKAQIGLPFRFKLVPMRPDIQTQQGTTHGSLVKVAEMGISFLNTRCAKYGVSDDKLFSIDYDNIKWTNTGQIDGLFSGDVVVSVDGGFTTENNLIISGDSPLPCTIRCLVPRIEKTGR